MWNAHSVPEQNAIVWPQDECLPSVVPGELVMEDFYVQPRCCTSCGVPQAVAPDLVGWTGEKYPQCYWKKQPQSADELDRAIKIIQSQELGCHRYSGKDPTILQRLSADDCDHLRPDLRLNSKPRPDFNSSGPSPKFSLSVSAGSHLLRKLWRKTASNSRAGRLDSARFSWAIRQAHFFPKSFPRITFVSICAVLIFLL